MRQLELFESFRTEAALSAEASQPAEMPPAPRRSDGGLAPRELERRLRQLLDGGLLSLTLTDNRTRIVSAKNGSGGLDVRIHRSFLHASPETLKKVAEFVNGARGSRRRRALAEIREHFERHQRNGPKKPRRKAVLEPAGRFFNLLEIRDEVNRLYFASSLDVEITWGRTPPRRRRGQGFSVRLGSYHASERLVRVHRALDRRDVPRFVVESVVYHEMLHAAIPPVKQPGRRRQLHPPEFRRREREFPHYGAAEEWLAENLARLAGVE